jgi:nitrate reductase gamma subunit
MNGQALVYFGISGGTLLLALSLLRKRFIDRDVQAVSSRGGYTMFAILMLLFSAGSFLAGYFSRS